MEQAYGEAYKAGLSNVVGALDSKINDLKTVASFVIPFAGSGGNTHGKGTTTQMATSLMPNSGVEVPMQLENTRTQLPLNNYNSPFLRDRQLADPLATPYPYSQQGWITNPTQFRP